VSQEEEIKENTMKSINYYSNKKERNNNNNNNINSDDPFTSLQLEKESENFNDINNTQMERVIEEV
jgi:hypothetical protein